jgi:hypothetical protein
VEDRPVGNKKKSGRDLVLYTFKSMITVITSCANTVNMGVGKGVLGPLKSSPTDHPRLIKKFIIRCKIPAYTQSLTSLLQFSCIFASQSQRRTVM